MRIGGKHGVFGIIGVEKNESCPKVYRFKCVLVLFLNAILFLIDADLKNE